jgi:hypothetical protein
MDTQHETLMMACRSWLSGGEWGNSDSLAPLICNTANVDYGRLVELKANLFIVTHLGIVNGKEIKWDDEYDKIRVDCGAESMHVYLHENYRESTPENIDRIVLGWMKEQEEML